MGKRNVDYYRPRPFHRINPRRDPRRRRDRGDHWRPQKITPQGIKAPQPMKRYTPALILASLALLGSFLPSLSFAATILDTTSAFGSGNNIHYSGYTNGIAWGAVYLGTLSSNLLSTDTLHIEFYGCKWKLYR